MWSWLEAVQPVPRELLSGTRPTGLAPSDSPHVSLLFSTLGRWEALAPQGRFCRDGAPGAVDSHSSNSSGERQPVQAVWVGTNGTHYTPNCLSP